MSPKILAKCTQLVECNTKCNDNVTNVTPSISNWMYHICNWNWIWKVDHRFTPPALEQEIDFCTSNQTRRGWRKYLEHYCSELFHTSLLHMFSFLSASCRIRNIALAIFRPHTFISACCWSGRTGGASLSHPSCKCDERWVAGRPELLAVRHNINQCKIRWLRPSNCCTVVTILYIISHCMSL